MDVGPGFITSRESLTALKISIKLGRSGRVKIAASCSACVRLAKSTICCVINYSHNPLLNIHDSIKNILGKYNFHESPPVCCNRTDKPVTTKSQVNSGHTVPGCGCISHPDAVDSRKLPVDTKAHIRNNLSMLLLEFSLKNSG